MIILTKRVTNQWEVRYNGKSKAIWSIVALRASGLPAYLTKDSPAILSRLRSQPRDR
jgi:hypothetical protein